MIRIGIVGPDGSKLDQELADRGRIICRDLLKQHMPCILVSGGCPINKPFTSIDVMAEEEADKLGIPKENQHIKRPKDGHHHWPFEGECHDPKNCYGFKARNIDIANDVDILYCLVISDDASQCYHCKTTGHHKNGGCWVRKEVIKKGKQGVLRII